METTISLPFTDVYRDLPSEARPFSWFFISISLCRDTDGLPSASAFFKHSVLENLPFIDDQIKGDFPLPCLMTPEAYSSQLCHAFGTAITAGLGLLLLLHVRGLRSRLFLHAAGALGSYFP